MSENPNQPTAEDSDGESEFESWETVEKFADNLEEKSFDHLYEDLKLEILKKHVNAQEDSGHAYYCKVCGVEKRAIRKIPTCLNCGVPVCDKCRSCGYCLNCFIQLTDDSRKSLKLMRALTWAVPLFSVFLLFFRGWVDFLLIELFLVVLFGGLYFYLRNRVKKFPERYVNHKWQYLVKSAEYQEFLDPGSKKRFIPDEWKEDAVVKRQAKIQKLKDWIEPKTDFSDVPIPAHYQEGGSDNLSPEDQPDFQPSEKVKPPEIDYKLINQACPNCKEIIIFADFCPNCNVRFCPECREENNPYNNVCVCGFEFLDLEIAYEQWREKKKI
jgi:hypothetical protein